MIAARGRIWVAFWLVFTLGALGWVVARQTASVVAASDLAALRETRGTLESERATLQRRIREAESPQVLVPKAAAMGLYTLPDSATTRLQSIERP